MLVKCNKQNNQRGIGLLELMLSLSIIAILLVMATRYYISANQSQQISNSVSMVSGVISGGANYSTQNNGSYANVSLLSLVQGGYIPASFCGSGNANGTCTGQGADPFHGDLNVSPVAANNYQITMNNIPTNICPSVANMVNASIENTQVGGNSSNAACNGQTLVVTVY